jgi:hypothetical protein
MAQSQCKSVKNDADASKESFMVNNAQAAGDFEAMFADIARITIQVQMKKRDIGYRKLTEQFNEHFRQNINERAMRNKIARGTFSAAFFLMCLNVLDCRNLELTLDDFLNAPPPKLAEV